MEPHEILNHKPHSSIFSCHSPSHEPMTRESTEDTTSARHMGTVSQARRREVTDTRKSFPPRPTLPFVRTSEKLAVGRIRDEISSLEANFSGTL
ncbi:hypothetical protein FPOA_04164 [Fusarium poae]|uniref:Uncharacterized protein n=1 Tax=Fusarium poae TaxID=36050 RepID=A0A1B8ASU7_FUSPO|nr:hypothetical protein FPOA_04164 [Fusarium poae]